MAQTRVWYPLWRTWLNITITRVPLQIVDYYIYLDYCLSFDQEKQEIYLLKATNTTALSRFHNLEDVCMDQKIIVP